MTRSVKTRHNVALIKLQYKPVKKCITYISLFYLCVYRAVSQLNRLRMKKSWIPSCSTSREDSKYASFSYNSVFCCNERLFTFVKNRYFSLNKIKQPPYWIYQGVLGKNYIWIESPIDEEHDGTYPVSIHYCVCKLLAYN